MFSVGLSSCSKELNEKLFADYRSAGITHMELSADAQDLAELDFNEVRESADRYGITLWSMHIPFSPFFFLDPSDTEKQEVTLAYFRWCIKKGVGIGVHTFVVHPSAEPIEETDRARRLETAKQTLASLADFAKQFDAVIAVENLPRTCLGRDSKDILELLSAHPDLRCCYDTNHLLSEDAVEFIHAVGDKIITTHVSDYDFLNERHWLPGEGKVDWQKILSALREVGYKGPWLYELGFAAPASIKREHRLTCADFARNAQELFAGQEPTVFGTPVAGLKAWR
ncbi:MAG: sugar phosphate isomerase/epimerase [Ruminococcaceae bacterium]|nr:sugar phosphate isomerase/epimerase [Oscillospiraceae bacterium]